MRPIEVQMLGDFILTSGDTHITDAGKRGRKNWSLLAYLICNRQNAVSRKKMIELLHLEDAIDPESSVRTALHRLRKELDVLWPGAGKELLLSQEGGCRWNPDCPLTGDWERFEKLASAAPTHREALALYSGEFLPRHSNEDWVVPIAAHYQNLFIDRTLSAAKALLCGSDHQQAELLCRRALEAEPYHEGLHQVLMQALARAKNYKAVESVYQSLKGRLWADFGIAPSRDTRNVYRACLQAPTENDQQLGDVMLTLQEETDGKGALFCEYDQFQLLCQHKRRAMTRTGEAVHVGLLTITRAGAMTRDQWEDLLERFGAHIQKDLRRGDVIARCSIRQYVILLPASDYENSSMVCRRIIARFHRMENQPDVEVKYLVHSLDQES